MDGCIKNSIQSKSGRLLFFGMVCLALAVASGQGFASSHDNGTMHRGEARHDGGHMVQSEFDFLVEMIPHHQEAIDSAREIGALTERPELREFAEEVIRLQQREIREMEEWIDTWYPEEISHARYEPMMRDLRGLPVEDAERLFLEDMITHHEMAVKKAEQVLSEDLAEHPEVARMAREIVETQGQEIELMQKWIDEWF